MRKERKGKMNKVYPFELKELPYSYDALEPVLGSETLHFHHDKHMSTYVNNLNAALESCPELHSYSLCELLKKLDQLPQAVQTAVRNNGGGVYNHELYFSTLTSPNRSTQPSDTLQSAIERDFGSVEEMFAKLKQAAVGRFGSGWAYVVTDADGSLSICSTANQDVPDLGKVVPLMTVDVWEHAYYLDYQNRRPDYVGAFISLINWDIVSKKFEERKSNL